MNINTNLRKKKKIAVIHPHIICGGGSELSAIWVLESLKNNYDVTFITMEMPELRLINKCFGTNLKEKEFKLISLPIPWFFRKRFDALRSYKLARFCKKNASKFDLLFSTDNVMDFGKKGMQLIVDFTFSDYLRRKLDPSTAKDWLHRGSFLRRIYMKFSEFMLATSKDGWKKNFTISVSDWIGKIMKNEFGIDSATVYPPVISNFSDVPWEKRENRFLCIARISPEKEIDKVIRIIREVRKINNTASLDILGRVDDKEYAELIKKMCKENKDWCFLRGTLYGQEKLDFIARHKFAISGRTQEPGAFAVAEMVKAGCIAFVPNGGGQVEIANQFQIIYDNEKDAVQKIINVLDNNNLQVEIRQQLAENIKKFSVECFCQKINNLVEEFLK
jgi:glycosyltransferase involved in cell wall biosynthesis